MPRANSTRFVLLGLLAQKPATGYELRRAIQQSLAPFWSESFGQIYPALRQMTVAGLLSATERSAAGRPPRRQYRITARGRAELAKWLEERPRTSPVRDELRLKLWLAEPNDGPAVLGHIREFRARQSTRAASSRTSAEVAPGLERAGPPFQTLTARLELALAEAGVRWADEAIKEIEGSVRREGRTDRG